MDTRGRRRHISAAYRYSFAGLVLNYYLYYESTWEKPDVSEEEKADAEEFGRILGEFLDGEDALKDLDKLRNRIIKRVEMLTGYTDCFIIYEYVFNRIERRFVTLKDSEYTPKRLAAELVSMVSQETQAAGWNERLQNIISQLPVRFTRQKFYGMVKEKLAMYAGMNRDNVENFLDILRSSAMLRLPEGMEQERELYQVLMTLRQADYRAMDKDEYERCHGDFTRASRILMSTIDNLVLIASLVDDLYVLFLTRGEAIIDAAEDQAFRKGASSILHALESNDHGFLDEEGEKLLHQVEGIQEAVEDIVLGGSGEDDEVLSKVDKLVSGSHFMSLEAKEESKETVDNVWMEKKAEEFCRDLDRMFAGMPKAVVRSVMAKVLSSLPVTFNSVQEAQDYICSSLESCSDLSEREASMELLEQELME